MIKGNPRCYLTPADILLKVTEYDIYRHYLGRDFTINQPINSPFREDPVASFLIGYKNNKLCHVDFGDSRYKGGCFDFVMQREGLSFPGAIERIARDFNIIKHSGTKESIAPVYKQPKILHNHISTIIQVIPKQFTQSDLKYWNGYYQDISDLKRENIYSIKSLYINKKKVDLEKDELAFGYLYNNKWKIYRPFSKDKWRSNISLDTVDGLYNIQNCENGIVTKSKKDKMVLLKISPFVCSVQNESIGAFNQKTIKYLKENAKIIYLNFDSDKPGKTNSFKLTKELNFRHVNVPDGYVKKGIKDFAALALERDLERVRSHFKRKKII